MARVKTGTVRRKRHKRLLKRAEGYRGARRRQFKSAKEAVVHAARYAYAGRKLRKRQARTARIMDINAAARMYGLTYSKLMNLLARRKLSLNRKDLATTIHENPESLKMLLSKGSLSDAKTAQQKRPAA